MVSKILIAVLLVLVRLTKCEKVNLVNNTKNDIPHYDCAQAGTICSLYSVTLDRENYRYSINSENPLYVQDVVFEISTIPFFTAIDLCTTFPFLFSIRAENVRMEEIDADAFDQCNVLTTLELSHNKLTVIPSTVFKRPYPQFLELADNQISQIDKITFANLELELLDLAGNNLNTFPIDSFKNANFKLLFLQSNDLVDLDVEYLIEKHPFLSVGQLIYGGNDISCSRLEEINLIVKRAGIIYLPIEGFDPYYPKQRFYIEDQVEGLPCLPDKSYLAMFYRKLFLNYDRRIGTAKKLNINKFKEDLEQNVADLLENLDEF